MFDVIMDAVIDNIKILPFLFLTYLLMEYLEDKLEDTSRAALRKAGKVGPIWGALLGALPQCGFSAAASNLYAGRVISVGTLIAIYLSTSDEMLPILISEAVSPVIIFKILLIKIVIGIIAGFIIDFVYVAVRRKSVEEIDIHHFCEHEHCSCGHGILRPAIRHTFRIFFYLLIITAVLNMVVEFVGLDGLSGFILNKPFVGELLSGVIGLIPNCGASVVITTLYLQGGMPLGTMMSGLLVGAGLGILILIRVNEDRKQNLFIIGILYVIGVISGMIINLLGIVL